MKTVLQILVILWWKWLLGITLRTKQFSVLLANHSGEKEAIHWQVL